MSEVGLAGGAGGGGIAFATAALSSKGCVSTSTESLEPFFFFTLSAEVETEAAVLEVALLRRWRLFALWLEPTFEAAAVVVVVDEAVAELVKALLARPANEELCGKASFGS